MRREGRTITLAGYRDSGGVRSAIAITAEQALAALDDEGQAVARRILLRMVELRPDGDDARRWVSHRELSELDPIRAPDVVATLAGARLVVVDRDQVTVVHEALLHAWPRLSGWIVEQRADLLARQEVRWAAERWAEGGRSDGDLYRGSRLDAALDLDAREPLPGREAEFVEAGRRLRGREQADARRRRAAFASLPRSLRCSPSSRSSSARSPSCNATTHSRHAPRPTGRRRSPTLAAPVPREWRSGRTTGPCCSRRRDSTSGTAPRRARQLAEHDRAQPPGARTDPQRPASNGRRGQRADRSTGDRARQPRRGHVVRHVHSAGRGEPRKSGDGYRVPDFSPDGDVVAVSSFSTECLGSADCADATVEVFDARDLRPRGVRYDGFSYRAADVAYSPDGSSLATIGPLPWADSGGNIAVWRVDAPGEPARRLSLRDVGGTGSSRRTAQNPAGSGSRPTVPACTRVEPARRSPSTWPPVKRWPASTGSVRSPSAPMGGRSRST